MKDSKLSPGKGKAKVGTRDSKSVAETDSAMSISQAMPKPRTYDKEELQPLVGQISGERRIMQSNVRRFPADFTPELMRDE